MKFLSLISRNETFERQRTDFQRAGDIPQKSFLRSGATFVRIGQFIGQSLDGVKSDWQQGRGKKYAIFVRAFARVFRAAACDTHVRHRDLHYWSAANIVGPVVPWSLAGTLAPLPLVPGRIASRATLPLSRSRRGWRLETTISSSRRLSPSAPLLVKDLRERRSCEIGM